MDAQERADKIVLDWNKSTVSTPIALMIAEAIEDAERDAWNAAAESAANWVRYTEKLNARIAELEARIAELEANQ